LYSKSPVITIYIVAMLFLYLISSAIANNRPETLKEYFQSFAAGQKDIKQESWLSPDKGYHIIGSMITTTLAGQLSLRTFNTTQQNSQIIGAGVSFTLGVLKEVHDSGTPDNIFSWKDLAANGVGIFIGILLLGIN